MSRHLVFRIVRPCAAPREVVYAVLEDVPRWRFWMPGVRSSFWEERGANGVAEEGAIRSMTARGITAREQIIASEPPHHQAYRMLSGLPVTDYRADIRIDRSGPGSVITWEATFAPKVWGTGHIIRLAMQTSIAKVAGALTREAERTCGIS